MALYPLKFDTIFKDKIWGGNKIKTILKKDYDLSNCGETWEISGVKGNISVVSEGGLKGKDLTSLIDEYKGTLVGEKVFKKFGNEFPLLIKFIDANADLSIQVHPDDKLAKERHDSFGKTEMWYVLQADEKAELITGFNRPLDKETYLQFFNSGKLTEILNKESVNTGDVFFLPAGRVHTIGKGLLIAEIQQTSDITYRIYDFDRVDSEGNKRELHVEASLDAIDYSFHDEYKTKYENAKNTPSTVVSCDYFTTNKLVFNGSTHRDLSAIDSFKIYICLEGEVEIEGTTLVMGEAALIPASLKTYDLKSSNGFAALEVFVP